MAEASRNLKQRPIPSTAASESIGITQAQRLFRFAITFCLFAIFTYLAFFQVRFPAGNSSRGNIFSAQWWLRPIEFNAASRINQVELGVDFTCVAFAQQDIWIGGTKGVIIHSSDGGETWKQLPTVKALPSERSSKPPPSKASIQSATKSRNVAFDDSERDDWILVESNKSRPSPPESLRVEQIPLKPANQAAPNKEEPSKANEPPSKPVYSVTGTPGVLRSSPAPTLPPVPIVLTSNDIVDLAFVSPRVGYALTAVGEFLATPDGGQTWRLMNPIAPNSAFAVRIKFIDEKRGVAVGSFGVARTLDGGQNWRVSGEPPSLVSDIAFFTDQLLDGWAVGLFKGVIEVDQTDPGPVFGTIVIQSIDQTEQFAGMSVQKQPSLNSIARTGSGTFFACGDAGVVIKLQGTRPQQIKTGITDNLDRILFISSNTGWAVGRNGAVIATADGGQNWEKRNTPPDSDLRAIYFEASRSTSNLFGFVAGTNGAVFSTHSGGRDWTPVVTSGNAESRGRYGWVPPPWYFLSLLLLLGYVRMIPDAEPAFRPQGISQLLLSDKPIEAADPDFLGFRQVAWGLSNYLRNNATNPPLTIAVTGEWGMGKSSLMNLINADLRHYGFRPVWFNAWHHQTEESLLATLLENVRTQSIPSIFTPEGIVFRIKLLWLRARRNLLAFLLIVAAIALCLSYFAADPHRLTQPPEALLKLLTNPSEAISRLKIRQFEVGKTIVVLTATLGAVLAFLKGFRPFGVDPASLLASKSRAAKAKDLRAQTSFRYEFARQFREVTESLNPLTMVLFVDDLDRCQPDQVYNMLEAINFLVSAGDCFVIMGFARRRVERCIGLVFEKVAAERPDPDGETPLTDLQKRERFAQMYLEKLINIEVPVPSGNPEQIRRLLINKIGETIPPRNIDIVGQRISDLLPHLVPIGCAVVVSIIAVWSGLQMFPPVQFKPSTDETKIINRQTGALPKQQSQEVSASELIARPKAQIGAANFFPGQTGHVPLWAILVVTAAILTPGIIRLSRRSGAVIEDSPEFVGALDAWFPFLIKSQVMTPRAIKRFVNRVRYFAMMEGQFRPAPRWWEFFARFGPKAVRHSGDDAPPADSSTPEALLVAIATIFERNPEWFDTDLDAFKRNVAAAVAEKSDYPTLDVKVMLDHLSPVAYAHFKKLVAGVEVR